MQKEKIIKCAVHYDDGKDYSEYIILHGSRRFSVFAHVIKGYAGLFYVSSVDHGACTLAYVRTNDLSKLEKCKVTAGFVTDMGRFVDRKEAAIVAFNAGQIEQQKKFLTSNDLFVKYKNKEKGK